MEVSIDGTTWAPVDNFAGGTSTHAFSPPSDGAYTVRFRAVDAAGNVDPSPASLSLIYDTTEPVTAVTTENNAGFATTLQITGTVSDAAPGAVTEVQVSTDGGNTWSSVSGNTQPSWTHDFAPGADGAYTLSFRAIDAAVRRKHAGVGDRHPHDARYYATRNEHYRVAWRVRSRNACHDGWSRRRYRTWHCRSRPSQRDGTTWSTVSGNGSPAWTHEFVALSEGAYTLRFRAVDSAGNVIPSPAVVDFIYDATEPSTTVTTASNSTFNGAVNHRHCRRRSAWCARARRSEHRPRSHLGHGQRQHAPRLVA